MYLLRETYRSLLHLLYPHICAGCGSVVNNVTSHICITCLDALPLTHFEKLPDNPVEKKFYGRLPLIAASAYCFFTPGSHIQQLVHEIKYRGNKELGRQLGQFMGEAIKLSGRIKPEMLVPLPLYASKERTKGYNQAALLCQGIADRLGVPMLERAVIRTEYTDSQTKKGRMERWENVDGKFEVTDSAAIKDKHVLLVDDVITTGATLEACGMEMLSVENVTLSIATLCVAGR